jgi:asparagine synthase (glutamine-hydrolysing)
MCGIAGFTGPQASKPLISMLDLIAHRGPDGTGKFESEAINLGHRRLAVIDPEGGAQPFISADGRYILAYNGEIYNFLQLKERLEQEGVQFKTKSDTEVLLYWLAAHGVDGLRELNGMFAFALWDTRESTLLLARDRLGIKPLYYTHADGRLVFGSEIKALLPWIDKRNAHWSTVFSFLCLQNTVGEATFFEGVQRLTPGSWMTWSPDGERRGKYWEVNFDQKFSGSVEDSVSQFTEIFEAAAKRHVIADVPVGAYLSSGLDSSAVVNQASVFLPRPMNTFTGAFGDGENYDERYGAKLVASSAGANHNSIAITPQHFVDNFEKVVWHLDEPTLGTGALPQYVTSSLAAEHVKVVLTGHGGDELFGGYQVFKTAMIGDAARHSPWALAKALGKVRYNEWSRMLYYLIGPLLYPEVRHGMFIMTAKRQRQKAFGDAIIDTVSCHEPIEALENIVAGPLMEKGQKLTKLYLQAYLPTLLIQEDKMGMAHSLEARMPLCDNELIDFALSLPLDLKLDGGHLKSIPRQAMMNRLPAELFSMPKRGFPTPFAHWFRQIPVKDMMHDLLVSQRSRERGIYRAEYVEREWKRHQASSSDTLVDYARANRLYSMAVVEQWFRTFVDA